MSNNATIETTSAPGNRFRVVYSSDHVVSWKRPSDENAKGRQLIEVIINHDGSLGIRAIEVPANHKGAKEVMVDMNYEATEILRVMLNEAAIKRNA